MSHIADSDQQIDTGALIRSGKEVLFQAFNWESHSHNRGWWENLERKVPDIAKSGFTSVWLPPPSQSHYSAPQGYFPQNLYDLNSAYGSEKSLRALLQKLKQHRVRAMADIVINHRAGTSTGHGGRYNRYDVKPVWDERAVTSCTGGLGNPSTGDNFEDFPSIDHTQDFVRRDIIEWLWWLRQNVGFEDFRFDFAKGYSAEYVQEYIEGARPLFSVGEYWVDCYYNDLDSHRRGIVGWIERAGNLSTAFDFTTKAILQEAVEVNGQYLRLRDPQSKPPGVMGWRPSMAVTFLHNQYTGSTQARWPFPDDHIMEGYAYILTHPGIPTVFYDHFYDQFGYNGCYHDQIAELIDIRRRQEIHSSSPVNILVAQSNLYSAMIGDKVCMKIGDDSWSPEGREWALAISGDGYAVWEK